VTPLYPQKLALTSPTGGGRSVGIVRSRTKATEFSLVLVKQWWNNTDWGKTKYAEKSLSQCPWGEKPVTTCLSQGTANS